MLNISTSGCIALLIHQPIFDVNLWLLICFQDCGVKTKISTPALGKVTNVGSGSKMNWSNENWQRT